MNNIESNPPAFLYIHHRIRTAPRCWRAVSDNIQAQLTVSTGNAGELFGIWRSQIGRPRDELNMISVHPSHITVTNNRSSELIENQSDVTGRESRSMIATLRPVRPDAPRRQGNYAFRYFSVPDSHWEEFKSLCTAAWPGFESAYDSQVIGLWRFEQTSLNTIECLLLTRRPDLAQWERSKLPEGEEEIEVRRKLSKRYDLCDATVVYTSTLLTAEDKDDTARWS